MSLEQIKRDLEKDIVKNKSKLETWKRVTYLTKKDGLVLCQDLVQVKMSFSSS